MRGRGEADAKRGREEIYIIKENIGQSEKNWKRDRSKRQTDR